MIIERFTILVGLALLIVAGWGVLRIWRARKLRQLASDAPLTELAPLGRPAVVAFSTPTCVECKSRQAPALARLAGALGDTITVCSLSALEHPDLVDRIGILTVPATVVLDQRGVVRHLNLGFASDQQLREQVLAL